jgi:uncharacterized protein
MLSPSEILELEDILFSEQWADDALDFFGLHGLVCASAVGPRRLDRDVLFALATGQDPGASDLPPASFTELCEKLERAIRSALEQGETIELPEPEEDDPHNALENWCAGFVDGFLLMEDEWLANDEENVASLLVPMMALSSLFEDDDFQKVRESEALSQELAEQIPDALTDLYLLFHSPQ